MGSRMEDLPEEVQEELVAKRTAAEEAGWSRMAYPTPQQWMAFYDDLGPDAREFLVDGMLRHAEQGAICFQADHESSVQASWEQLREVVKLYNSRVDEVAMLRDVLARGGLEAPEPPPAPAPDLPESELIRPPKGARVIPVRFGEQTPTGQELYIAMPAEDED